MSCCLALWLRPSLTYMEALQVMSQPHAARLTEMTSFFPPPTQTVIEDVFSNGVKKKKKKKCRHFLGLAFQILYVVHASAVLVWGAGSEVFALWEEMEVRTDAEDVLIPERIVFCGSVSLHLLH